MRFLRSYLLVPLAFSAVVCKAQTAPPPPPSASAQGSRPTSEQPYEGEITTSVRQDGANKVEEFSVNGRVYAVRVTPPTGAPYLLTDPLGNGHYVRDDGPGGRQNRGAQWTIFQW